MSTTIIQVNPRCYKTEVITYCLLYNEDSTKLQRMMDDFSVYNKKGVIAAKQMVDNGMFSAKAPSAYSIEEIFNILVDLIDKAE